MHFLDEYGPGVGLPTLQECFPDMLRAEQEDLLRRYRRVWRERHRVPLRVLHWPEPGRVWAIDFAEAPTLIEGRFPYLFAVRDLASGMSLLWLPVEHACTAPQKLGAVVSGDNLISRRVAPMAKPRKFSPEFKAKIALAALRGDRTLAALCLSIGCRTR